MPGAHAHDMTSQLPTLKWHTYLDDVTLADAILDRLIHNAHKIKLKGESMRKVMNSSLYTTADANFISIPCATAGANWRVSSPKFASRTGSSIQTRWPEPEATEMVSPW